MKRGIGFIFNRHSEGVSPKNLNNCHAELVSASYDFEIPKRVRNDRKGGFTLAEVLITLTIIGVIAALTIPNLMQAWRKHTIEAQLKEAYSIVSNTLKMAESEHGMNVADMITDAYNNGNPMQEYYVDNYFLPYVKYSKTCKTADGNKCNLFPYTREPYKTGDVSNTSCMGIAGNPNYYTQVLLENGMLFNIERYNQNIIFKVDVNGSKGPNLLARDIFFFRITNSITWDKGNETEKLYFSYTGSRGLISPEECKWPIGSGCYYGECAAKIMLNGWKIPDDYPFKDF